jgi:hypothetical protein
MSLQGIEALSEKEPGDEAMTTVGLSAFICGELISQADAKSNRGRRGVLMIEVAQACPAAKAARSNLRVV